MKNERAPVNDVIGIIQRRLNMAEKVGADSATDRAIAAECRTILDALRQPAPVGEPSKLTDEEISPELFDKLFDILTKVPT